MGSTHPPSRNKAPLLTRARLMYAALVFLLLFVVFNTMSVRRERRPYTSTQRSSQSSSSSSSAAAAAALPSSASASSASSVSSPSSSSSSSHAAAPVVAVASPPAVRTTDGGVVSSQRAGLPRPPQPADDWDAVGPDGQQYFHGHYGVRADGTLGWRPQDYVHYKTESAKQKNEHHRGYAFNKWRSDQLPLSLPRVDQRSSACRALSTGGRYSRDLPNTSVVIVAFNEPLSTLFRSVHSVLDRTPPALLHEIIVVDDGSTFEWFGRELEEYIALLPKTRLERMGTREGLMAARVRGARVATGETITFLDSHIEALHGWLQPLLQRVKDDYRNCAMPVIDMIDADTWEYTLGGISILGFSWTLGQVGVFRKAPADPTAPMASPIMAGGLFTISRRWFFELGAYDPEFRIYGGEELEISWKIWQCGGRLECLPCSRVGHIFRSKEHWQGQVFTVPEGAITRNKLRAAETWMDEEQLIVVRQSMPKLPRNVTLGDIEPMRKIRRDLQCKSFAWYLDNVYPEFFVPKTENFRFFGEIRNVASSKCMDTEGKEREGDKVGCWPCHGQKGRQHWIMSKSDELRFAGGDWTVCLDANGGREGGFAVLWKCHGQRGAQEWKWDETSRQLRSVGLCLAQREPNGATMQKCDAADPAQVWELRQIA